MIFKLENTCFERHPSSPVGDFRKKRTVFKQFRRRRKFEEINFGVLTDASFKNTSIRRHSEVVGKLFGPFGLSLNRRPTNDEKLFVFDRQLDLLLFCLLLPHY